MGCARASARPPLICHQQIDRIVRDTGLTREQRRRLHDEISRQDLDLDEVREIAKEIKEDSASNDQDEPDGHEVDHESDQ